MKKENLISVEKPSKEVLEELYIEQKKSVEEIGFILGVHSSKVKKWVKSYNLQRIVNQRSIKREILIDLYITKRKTRRYIAMLFGTSEVAITRALRKHKIFKNNPDPALIPIRVKS